VQILLWLLPAAVVTAVAMGVVGWVGRDGRGRLDRETRARILGEALSREVPGNPGYAVPRRTPERSTGVALRGQRRQSEEPAADVAVEPPPFDVPEPGVEVEGVTITARRAS
jgi:hypothetical protein